MNMTITFGGQVVELASAEQALLERRDVVEAVAIGVDDAFLGQALNVWVVPAPGIPVSHDLRSDMLSTVDDRVGVRPRSLRFVDRLPRAADGGPARAAIAALLNGTPLGGLDGANDVEALDAIRQAR